MTREAVQRLLTSLGELLRARLTPALKALFDAADDSLFEMAEHCTDGMRQQAFFNGMRECRRQRGHLERATLARLIDRLQETRDAPRPTGADALSLVPEEELEETVAVSGMIERAESSNARALHALTQRFGFLLGDVQLSEANLPVGPARISKAFANACEPLDLDTEARLVLYKLFDRHVLGTLGTLYSEINIQLADAGVLPTLSASSPLSERRKSRPEESMASAAPEQRHDDAELAAETTALVGRALELITRRRAELQGTSKSTQSQGEGLSAATLLGALTRVQRQVANHPDHAPKAGTLKQQILRESERLGAAEARLSSQDEHTIDLLGLLFQHVEKDDNLPEPLQPTLARMHLPMLQTALSEPGMLSDEQHPARLLLDELGQAAQGWSANADPGGRMLSRIRSVVDTVVGKYEGDSGIFERGLREFRGFVDATRRRAELSEQRAVEAAMGRERLQLARRKVRQALQVRLQATKPLPWVRQVLNRPWANYLVLLWLRQGEQSEAYTDALGFADELIWCTQASSSPDDAHRLRSRKGMLETQLRQGLTTVAYHDSEIEDMLTELNGLLAWRLGEIDPPEYLQRGDEASEDTDFGPGADLDLEDQPLPDDIDPATLERIRDLRPGTWVEFTGEDGEVERAKLSWISPISGRCLFVNRTGLKVGERRPIDLVEDLEKGLAKVLEAASLLRRALNAVVEELQGGAPAAEAIADDASVASDGEGDDARVSGD